MAFNRPSLTTIIDRIKGDLKSGLSLTTILRRSFLDIMAKAYGAAVHTLFGFLDNIFKQFFPDTATGSFLLRWATIYGIARLDATFTELVIDVVGTTGGTLPIDQVFQRADGVLYKVKAEIIVPATTTVQATIVAVDAGANPNLDDGSTVTLVSAIAGIESAALVDSTAIEGDDQETEEALRVRLLERIKQPPSGGKVTDYIAFAKTVVGVTRVWVIPDHLGEGTVAVFFVEDNESPIFPSPAKVQEVLEALLEQAPISADVFSIAPTETEINPIIALKPNTTEVQDAVIAELEDLLFRTAEVAGAANPDEVGIGGVFTGKIPLSQINEAISIATGETDHVLTFPTSDVQPPTGGLVTLGTPVFSTLA